MLFDGLVEVGEQGIAQRRIVFGRREAECRDDVRDDEQERTMALLLRGEQSNILAADAAERKALANEMGCPMELREDSAKMNMWLHKTVLERIAYNGGNIPGHLLK